MITGVPEHTSIVVVVLELDVLVEVEVVDDVVLVVDNMFAVAIILRPAEGEIMIIAISRIADISAIRSILVPIFTT